MHQFNKIQRTYYEQSSFWDSDHFSTRDEVDRISETIKTIPSDTRSILDVGCGKGIFINTLSRDYPDRFVKITGLDPSNEALKYVQTEKVNQSIDDMRFENRSFDMVSCLEVLEHLPQHEFEKAISEIQRICKKYILISVPNEEILEQFLALCPKCSCSYNPYYHMRSFNKEMLKSLFSEFMPISIRKIGPSNLFYSYNRVMFFLRLCYGNSSPPDLSICPQCGYQKKESLGKNNTQEKSNLNFYKLLPFIKIFIKRRKKKRWLLAIYARRS